MPDPERRCPACHAVADAADAYCSSCGAALQRGGFEFADNHAAPGHDYAPLALSWHAPHDLQPLQIVPDNRRQRRRMLKRSIAALVTLAIACIFGITLFLAMERDGDAAIMSTLAIVSGLLTIVALGGWVNVAIRRMRKRARRHNWQMSIS